MLKTTRIKYHRVLSGQTLSQIAATYCTSEYALVKENHLQEEVTAGQILRLPPHVGNRYTVQAGEDKILLCGNKENYERKNGKHLYPGKQIVL